MSAEFRTRLHAVRMKDGASVHVLHRQDRHDLPENWQGKLVANAKAIASHGDLVGYMVVGIYTDGKHSTALRIDHDKCPVPMILWPSWFAEIVRRYTVTQAEAADVAASKFDEMFEWRDR